MKMMHTVYSVCSLIPIITCIVAFPVILLSRVCQPVANLYYWLIFVVSDFLILSHESTEVRRKLLQPMLHQMKQATSVSGFLSPNLVFVSGLLTNHLHNDQVKQQLPSTVVQVDQESEPASQVTKCQADPPAAEKEEVTIFRVLEIGPGTGTNLQFYPAGVSLSLIELNPLLHKQVNYIRKKHPHITIEKVILGNAEDMWTTASIGDCEFDAVVGTHICCCINNVPAALKEIHRVLKPKGIFYTCEFVSYAEDCKSVKKWIQKAYAPFWSFFSLGCKAGNQNVKQLLSDHSFDTSNLIEELHPTLPVTHAVTLYGSAVKI